MVFATTTHSSKRLLSKAIFTRTGSAINLQRPAYIPEDCRYEPTMSRFPYNKCYRRHPLIKTVDFDSYLIITVIHMIQCEELPRGSEPFCVFLVDLPSPLLYADTCDVEGRMIHGWPSMESCKFQQDSCWVVSGAARFWLVITCCWCCLVLLNQIQVSLDELFINVVK